ncbi:MAG TPA: hypothetical protein VKV39_20170 [Candidatus Sulfotelmatobacter sp.]|nr:hypothetical protein [Candidatus Sulfotelmatobacter sp.]
MEVGAIVVVEAESDKFDSALSPQSGNERLGGSSGLLSEPIEFVELLGRSLVERAVEQFTGANIKSTLVLHRDILGLTPQFRRVPDDLDVYIADDIWSAIVSVLEAYASNGIDCAFLARPSAYSEASAADLLNFHCEGAQTVTRAADARGPLDLWVVNSSIGRQRDGGDWRNGLVTGDYLTESYFVREYTRRITEARELRQLVIDAFQSRCHLHPFGTQLRPGIWADSGVQVQRGARVVGPSYLGRNCIIGEGALITRSSNIESGSHVDYGTVVEDTTVLANTYVGMWLDVRHSLVSASRLLNLERDVLVRISDPSLIRSNRTDERGVSKRTTASAAESSDAKDSRAEQYPLKRNVHVMNATAEFES